jgi:hypothetical protein
MRSVATVVFTVGLVLVGFPLTEVIVWGCALLGAFIFSHLITGVIWMGIEKVERRAVKSAKIVG